MGHRQHSDGAINRHHIADAGAGGHSQGVLAIEASNGTQEGQKEGHEANGDQDAVLQAYPGHYVP